MTTTPTQTPDYAAIKGRQRQTWGSGDYGIIAALIVPTAERLCEAVELHADERVLDVATGTGNAAIAAARRLCAVTGVDYAPALLERARARAEAEGLSLALAEEDAEALSAADGAYDVVLSTFGVMFSPNQQQAARELLRVCRPGGRIGLANWTPEGWIGEMLRIVGRHVPPPAGLRPATRWGSEDGVRELLGDGLSSLQATRQLFVWRFASPDQYLHLFRSYYGPTVKAFEALDEPRQQALANDLREALGRFAQPADDGTLLVPAEYLEVVAVRGS
jgi:ubiquinone/menaquinone biosynthesis C-methylase UbiE